MAVVRCWEFMKCGREQNCPAHPHSGHECWTMAGTACRGRNEPAGMGEVNGFTRQCPFFQISTGRFNSVPCSGVHASERETPHRFK
jgi:hypothetical protein